MLEREALNTQRRLGRLLLKSHASFAALGDERGGTEASDQLARLLALKIRDLRAEIAALDRAASRPLVVIADR